MAYLVLSVLLLVVSLCQANDGWDDEGIYSHALEGDGIFFAMTVHLHATRVSLFCLFGTENVKTLIPRESL